MYYFDNNATTKLTYGVLKRIEEYMSTSFANASSSHSLGQIVREETDEVREIIADYIKCSPVEIIFTSGASESNNFIIKGIASKLKQVNFTSNELPVIISNKAEHSSVTKQLDYLSTIGFNIKYLNLKNDGSIDYNELKELIDKNTILVTIQHSNSETGTIHDIEKIGNICKNHNIFFHSDITQAFKFFNYDVTKLNVDALSFSAHKINGPKGIGAVFLRKKTPIIPLIHGGEQEFNMRAGTLNSIGIIGFGEAVKELIDNRVDRVNYVKGLRDYFESRILSEFSSSKTHINGNITNRMPNTSNISFIGVSNDSLLYRLNKNEIYVSAGSACTSGSIQKSTSLVAMKLPDDIVSSAIRFSFSFENTKEEIDSTLPIIYKEINSILDI